MVFLYILEQIINGLAQGAIFALVAIGFTMILGITGLVTFCYGEIVMFGGFAAYYVFNYVGVNVPLAIIAAFLVAGLLGFIIHKICYEKFLNEKNHLTSLVCTLGMSILLKNMAQIVFGVDMKAMPSVFGNKYISLGEIRITYLQIMIVGVVILLSIILSIFLKKTRTGIALRSVKDDKVAAALVGINASRITTLGNVIGSALGGIAGVLFCLNYLSVDPLMGGDIGMKAFSAAVVGGMTSIPVAALGGVGIGVAENLSVVIVTSAMRNLIAYAILIIVLVVRPQGLVRKKKGM